MAQQPSDWATDRIRDRQLGDLANWSHQFIDLILTEHGRRSRAPRLEPRRDARCARGAALGADDD